jgi:hypothetical protein
LLVLTAGPVAVLLSALRHRLGGRVPVFVNAREF